ncbi:MAG: DM13 domain-containing protein [Dehalococcoidia bacterium]
MLAVTDELGRFEEFFSEVVYPAWPLWLAGALIALGVAGYFAYRLGLHTWAMEHRVMTGATVTIFLVVATPLGYYTISPLFDRETACEASPIANSGSGSEDCEGVAAATLAPTVTAGTSEPQDTPVTTVAPTEPAVDQPRVIQQGAFQGADDFHFGEGQALLIETGPSKYVLRFENFSVRNGPDLFVYLSPDPEGYGDGAVKLGSLKGTDGAFNYDVPEGTDVSQFKSAVIWCDQFSVLFATATFG